MEEPNSLIYFSLYIIIIFYFFALGLFMIHKSNHLVGTKGEMEAKQRMMRSVGTLMFTWSFEWLLYLPPTLSGLDNSHISFKLCFLITIMLNTPMLFVVMDNIVQKKTNIPRFIATITLPFLALIIWFVIANENGGDDYGPLYTAIGLSILYIINLLGSYAHEYHKYMRRVKAEYSDMKGHRLIWSWSCFVGFALLSLLFMAYQFFWTPTIELIYMGVSASFSAYLCYCICKQKALDYEILDEAANRQNEAEKTDDKAFFPVVEERLKDICEKKQLFLDPELTRETLCDQINVGRTYLSMYLSSRGVTFYQYINKLRIDYACQLMKEKPELSIREVSEQSGFRSQTTFRKMFAEVTGSLPSSVKRQNS